MQRKDMVDLRVLKFAAFSTYFSLKICLWRAADRGCVLVPKVNIDSVLASDY